MSLSLALEINNLGYLSRHVNIYLQKRLPVLLFCITQVFLFVCFFWVKLCLFSVAGWCWWSCIMSASVLKDSSISVRKKDWWLYSGPCWMVRKLLETIAGCYEARVNVSNINSPLLAKQLIKEKDWIDSVKYQPKRRIHLSQYTEMTNHLQFYTSPDTLMVRNEFHFFYGMNW